MRKEQETIPKCQRCIHETPAHQQTQQLPEVKGPVEMITPCLSMKNTDGDQKARKENDLKDGKEEEEKA